MGFPVNFPITVSYGPGLAIASNGSLAVTPFFAGGAPYTVVAARFFNGGRTNIASGTAAASAATVSVYKNASGTGSRVATINNNGTAIGSGTGTGTAMTLGAAANLKCTTNDILLIEVLQGGSSASALAANWVVNVDLVYGSAT